MTGPKDIIIGVIAVALLATSVTSIILKTKIKTLKVEVELYQTREEIYKENVESCNSTIEDLRATIDLQNEAARLAEDLGREAEEAQREAERIAGDLSLAEDTIRSLVIDNEEFKKLVERKSVCETMEEVLISISAGG